MDNFIRLYGIDYDKFRRNHAKSFQTVKGDPNIKIDPIENALFYINIQIFLSGFEIELYH